MTSAAPTREQSQATSVPAALALEGVRAGYGGIDVLHGVSLTVAQNAVVALLGANGAGKTTVLRAAAGIVPLTGGSVSIGGRPTGVPDVATASRGGVCLIPQGRGVFPRLTVAENIAMFVRGVDVGRAIDRATAAFPILGARLGQLAGTMSGGEQQMLAVSRALATQPMVVLADELSLGLAPAAVDAIFDRVAMLRDQGVALLIVEQYVGRALEIADYVYVLQKGEIVLVEEAGRCTDVDLIERYMGGAAA